MKRITSIIATICLFAGMSLSSFVFVQNAVTVQHTWMLTDGWMDQEELHFQRIKDPDAYAGWAQTFTFGENGSIGYRLMIPGGRGVCGNGLLYLDEGSYKISKQKKRMRISLTGGHMLYDQFEYEIKYKVILLTDDEMILRRKKVCKAEVKTGFGQEELG